VNHSSYPFGLVERKKRRSAVAVPIMAVILTESEFRTTPRGVFDFKLPIRSAQKDCVNYCAMISATAGVMSQSLHCNTARLPVYISESALLQKICKLAASEINASNQRSPNSPAFFAVSP